MLNIKTNKLKRIDSGSTIFTNFIHTILPLNKESILVGTNGSGLLLYNKKSETFTSFFDTSSFFSEEVKIIRKLFKDSQNNIWVGTDGDGLIKINIKDNSWTKSNKYNYKQQVESSLSGNAIYEIMEDDASNIWIGTAWNGINILEKQSDFEFFFSDINGENLAPVLSIYKNENNLFFGLDGNGLTVLNLNSDEVLLLNSESVGGKYIQCITESKNGSFWLGTFGNGLINFDLKNKSYTKYMHNSDDDNSISFNDVRSIITDKYDNLWVASWGGGLNYFNTRTRKFESFRENKTNPNFTGSDNIVVYMVEDNEWLWLATFGGGLEHFNTETKQLVHYKYNEGDTNSIGSNNILSLLRDSRDNLWVGTSDGGVNLLNIESGTINRFENEEVMRYQTVTGIVEDNDGDIWFSTKEGVFKYDYSLQEFLNFPFLDNEYHLNSAFKDERGILYFGTTSGVLRLDPKSISKKNTQPEVAITSFKLFNKELHVGDQDILTKNIVNTDSITLKYNLNVITFEFVALEFPFSEKCEYAIMMEGFDKSWRNIGFDRTITYTNLPHGNYEFKVKSKEAGGQWGEKYTAVNLTIEKPFWLEWWAMIFYLLFILFIFYLFRKYTIAWEGLKTNLKLEKLTHEKDIELNNLKQEFFTNISHDIRTPVTLILGSINRLVKGKNIEETTLNPIETIRKNGIKLVNLINELLDYRKFEFGKIKLHVAHEDIVEFCEEVYLSFRELAIQKEIDFVFKSEAKEINVWFDKIQFEKVLYNLLSNAFKYTKSSEVVEFFIIDKEHVIELTIRDKGIGIAKNQLTKIFNRFHQTKDDDNKSQVGFGLGLSISKEIIELHNGEIIVNSEKGKGTEFTIILKKGNEHFSANQIVEKSVSSEYSMDRFIKDSYELQKTEHITFDDRDTYKDNTILIVEDNIEIQVYISEFLKDDFQVLIASNGEEALHIVFKTPPDLIISDVMMPVMDGITLSRELKSNVRTSHIPIILLTARAAFSHKIEGFEIGADDYITKPFNELLLKSRIKNVLRNRKLLHDKFWKKDLIPLSELNLNKSDEEFMTKLMKILEDNLNSSNLKHVNFVCGELGMSHSVLYKKIKSLANMSYVEFVRDFKMKIAKKLIEEQNFSVSDACYHVGYADRKYFSKLFKKHFGKKSLLLFIKIAIL